MSRSVSLAATMALLRLLPTATGDAGSLRRKIAKGLRPAPVSRRLRRIADVEQEMVNGFPVIRLTPKAGASGAHLVYTHGGAYVFPLISAHWGIIANIIRRTGVSVTVPLYGLAPQHGVDEAYDLLDLVYDDAVDRFGDRVFLAGDSAGGALAVGQAIRARDAGKTAAAALILFSPWFDIDLGNPGVDSLEGGDVMLGRAGLVEAGRLWAGDHDHHSPLISPVFADLAGLPPVHIYQGERDILAPDAELFAKRMTDAGGDAHLTLAEGAFHVFVGAPWTPEARSALDDVGRVIRSLT
jgi:RND superfamily putative drug exporter